MRKRKKNWRPEKRGDISKERKFTERGCVLREEKKAQARERF